MTEALILIDLQNDYFPGGNMELMNTEQAAGNAARLLENFRKAGKPVIHIQHLSVRPGSTFFVPGTPGADIHPLVAPRKDEPVIQKNYPNSFRETALLELLRKDDVSELLICGAMSHMCIDATTRAAFDLGFNCRVAADACTTRDLTFAGRTVSAADVHAAFMAALAIPYAHIATTEELLSERS